MENIYWQKKFEVGIEDIDNQHSEFINSLIKCLHNDFDFEEIKNKIYEDLKHHFRFEEDQMKKTNYLGFYSHKMEHERFLNKFFINFNSEKLNTRELINEYFLSMFKWFINHLEINDRKLASHLRSTN